MHVIPSSNSILSRLFTKRLASSSGTCLIKTRNSGLVIFYLMSVVRAFTKPEMNSSKKYTCIAPLSPKMAC